MAKNREKEVDVSYDGCYGKQCKASKIVAWVERLAESNFDRGGSARWSGNIWGHAGVGKTSLLKSLENHPLEYKGKEYEGFAIVDIPLAQIEEMGDVLGCPDDFIEIVNGEDKKWILAKDSVINQYIKEGWNFVDAGKVVTRYAPPAWVPTEERPGIIIFDDGNRASIRIQKGLMQLVQDYRTIGWDIPDGWTILFTGNPDMQDYLVTSVDGAILTRQRHITMIPDEKEWAIWAENAGIDKRGINFILKIPEAMLGQRTNLRTLTEFFTCIKRFPNLETDDTAIESAYIDGMSLLDEETLTQFFTFVRRDMKMIIEPEHVLENIDRVKSDVDKLMGGKEPRVDIMGVTCDRLVAFLFKDEYKIEDKHVKNFQSFVTFDKVPEDMRHSLMKRIAESRKTELKKFLLGNKEILKFVAESLRVNV